MTERLPTQKECGCACADRISELADRFRDLELQLSAIIGVGQVPGWIQRIEKEQGRSAESQGKRIEELNGDVKATREILDATRHSLVDARARVAAGVAVILGMVSIAVAVLRLTKGGF